MPQPHDGITQWAIRANAALAGTRGVSRRTFLLGASLGIVTMALGARNLALATDSGVSAQTAAALSSAQSQYQDAMAQLATMTQNAESAQYTLNETQAQLDDTNAKIDSLQSSIVDTQQQLADAQDVLADRVAANYRAGNTSAIEVLLDATNFEDLTSRIYYEGKVSDEDAAAIQTVKDLKSQLEQQQTDLETKKTEQEQLVDQAQQNLDDLKSQVADMTSYTNSLSADVVALMNQAQQETIAAQEAKYQAYLAQKEAQQSSATSTSSQSGTSSGTAASAPVQTTTQTVVETVVNDQGDVQQVETQIQVPVASTPDPAPATDTPSYSEPAYSEPTYSDPAPSYSEPSYEEPSYSAPSYGGSGNHVSSVADIAWNYIGVPYVWGGTDPSGFDCSGLAQYCYAQAGYSIARTTYTQISQIQSAGNWVTDMGSLSAGDLVFPSTEHVGIYIGGGMMIHAPYPGEVVQYASVYAFYGGGCPV